MGKTVKKKSVVKSKVKAKGADKMGSFFVMIDYLDPDRKEMYIGKDVHGLEIGMKIRLKGVYYKIANIVYCPEDAYEWEVEVRVSNNQGGKEKTSFPID